MVFFFRWKKSTTTTITSYYASLIPIQVGIWMLSNRKFVGIEVNCDRIWWREVEWWSFLWGKYGSTFESEVSGKSCFTEGYANRKLISMPNLCAWLSLWCLPHLFISCFICSPFTFTFFIWNFNIHFFFFNNPNK